MRVLLGWPVDKGEQRAERKLVHRIPPALVRLDGKVCLRQRACMHAERPAIAPSVTGANGSRSASSSRRAMKKAHRAAAKGRKRETFWFNTAAKVLWRHSGYCRQSLSIAMVDLPTSPQEEPPAGRPLTKHLEETRKTRKAKFDATAVSGQTCACWSDDSRYCALCR